MKRKVFTVLAVLIMTAGIGILLYPVVSNLLYEQRQKELTEYYDNIVTELPEEEKDSQWEECRLYNDDLRSGGVLLTDPFDGAQLDPAAHPYVDLLNAAGDGAMGSLEIPAIGVDLVIYHGTEEEILQKGVGHLQGSSLPVGGTGTHAVLSAHTGLSDKKLFTDLDQLEEGDTFYIHVLGEVLAYQVDQIKVVLPSETEDLQINAEEDYVTLITCTPYGVNSHRLLVRGTRIPYEEAERKVTEASGVAAGAWLADYMKAGLAGVVFLIILAGIAITLKRKGLFPLRRSEDVSENHGVNTGSAGKKSGRRKRYWYYRKRKRKMEKEREVLLKRKRRKK